MRHAVQVEAPFSLGILVERVRSTDSGDFGPTSGSNRSDVRVGREPGLAKAAESGLVEGAAQVGDEILGGLDADRQPDERRIDL